MVVNIEEIKLNPANPRFIKDDKFNKLVKSLKEFPQMLELRPIIVDNDMIVLGGNMRLKACKEAGILEVPIIKASDLTDNQKKEFIIKDNISFGEWDNDLLNSWDRLDLVNWGFEQYEMIDIYGINELESKYTKALEESSFNVELTDVNDYIKQNILFFNEKMIEFEDDNIKEAIRNIKLSEDFINELKQIILKYGKDSI
jgi:hypothetical protein